MDYPLTLLYLFAFLAGFIDSIAGGGGLVSVPAFFILYPNLSVSGIIGTNRLASVAGTLVAARNYSLKVSIPYRLMVYAGTATAICSFAGAALQTRIPPEILKPVLLIVIIGIAIYSFSKKEFGVQEKTSPPDGQMLQKAVLIGGALGFYNGLIGPGTGTLLVFALVSALGYSLLKASAAAKIINATADLASLLLFLKNGFIHFNLAIPMMVFNILGSYTGSKMAILRGNQFVRKIFILVIVGVISRFAWDILTTIW